MRLRRTAQQFLSGCETAHFHFFAIERVKRGKHLLQARGIPDQSIFRIHYKQRACKLFAPQNRAEHGSAGAPIPVAIRDATKTYEGGVEALRGVSLDCAAGRVTALVGRSGCGKTTLLNLCGAMDFPTTGRVEVAGRLTSELSDAELTALRRGHIGFVFQFFQLLPSLTALENVELPLLLAGTKDSEAAARERLLWVGLSEKADALPYQLSGGQAQRVAIARALVHDPAILVADEPTGNLDTASGEMVLRLIRRAADEFGAAVVMATHSAEAAAIADVRVRMRDGCIENVED
jgi:ABC-type lipoprotein export system ATPase subunit